MEELQASLDLRSQSVRIVLDGRNETLGLQCERTQPSFMDSDTGSADFTSNSCSSAEDENYSDSTDDDAYLVSNKRNFTDESSTDKERSAENSKQSSEVVEGSEQSDSEPESTANMRVEGRNPM